MASKGIIKNGAIKIYALTAQGERGKLLKETVTDPNGVYHADLGSYQGPVVVEASGSYTDEATGAVLTVSADHPLRAALDRVAGESSAAVTPLTELAVPKSEDPVSHTLRVAQIAASNAAISYVFKVDIISTMPVDATVANSAASNEQKEHALVLAAISKLMQTKSEALDAVIGDMKGAIGTDNKIETSAAGEIQQALTQFAASPSNHTGITDVSRTALSDIGVVTGTLTISVSGNASPIALLDAMLYLPAGVTVKADANGMVLDWALLLMGTGFPPGTTPLPPLAVTPRFALA